MVLGEALLDLDPGSGHGGGRAWLEGIELPPSRPNAGTAWGARPWVCVCGGDLGPGRGLSRHRQGYRPNASVCRGHVADPVLAERIGCITFTSQRVRMALRMR